MILCFLRGLGHFVDDVLGGADVGVAHAQVDDIFTGSAGFHFKFVDGGEHIRGQSIQAGKPCHGAPQITRNGKIFAWIHHKAGVVKKYVLTL
jgi:hypothetical protein